MHRSRLIRSLQGFFLDLRALRPGHHFPDLSTKTLFNSYHGWAERQFRDSGSLYGDLSRLKELFRKMDDQTIEDAWNEFLVLQIMDS